MMPTPAPPPAPPREPGTPTPALPPELPTKPTTALPSDAGLLSLVVPEGAKVFVNDYETKSAGTQRQYVSYGLKAGLTYNYQIRVVAQHDGKTVEENRTVTLTAGKSEQVAFFDSGRSSRLALNW